MSLVIGEEVVEHRPDLPIYVDSTMMDLLMGCETKHFYNSIMHLRHGQKSTDLIAGGAYAKGLETFRKFYYGEGKSFEESRELAVLAAIVEYGDHTLPPESRKAKTWDRTCAALLGYWDEWHPEVDKLRPHGAEIGEPAIEFSFAIPLPVNHPTGQPLLYVGRCDMIGEKFGRQYVVDDKTTGAFSSTWADAWKTRGQFTGYTWAANESGQFDCTGAIVRGCAIQKTQTKYLEIETPRPMWLQKDWYRNMLNKLRYMVQIHEAMLNDWEKFGSVDRLSKYFGKNYGSMCSQYGNCSYIELCSSESPELLLSFFDRFVWNPMEEKEDKVTAILEKYQDWERYDEKTNLREI